MKLTLALCALALAGAYPATASVITSLPGGVAQVMPEVNVFGSGPNVFGDVTWTSTTTSVFGYTGGYSFNDNGNWDAPPMVGTDDESAAMNLTFAGPVAGFLAEINWAVYDGSDFDDAYMRAYDASDNLLELIHFSSGSTNLLAPGYWGFQRGTTEIARIELQGAYIGARNISLSDTVGGVPEPESWALMVLGFGGLGALMRNRRRALTAL
jgi:hypothetical protein